MASDQSGRPALGTATAPADGTSSRRNRRILVTAVAVLLGLVLAAAAAVYVVTESLGNNVSRIPGAFAGIEESARPAATDATTFLLVGTDSRSDEPTTGTDAAAGVNPGSQRSDVIMIARVAPDGTTASVTSIPRDSWVDIPGRGMNKINAAYAFGGAPLLIETIENLTGVRVDHFGIIDFAGFQQMVDSVGGIDVRVARATSNIGVDFHEGLNHLDGSQALAYVRQRYDLPGGDLDRAKRQQNALKSLLTKAGTTTSDPVGLYDLVDSTTRTVSIDDTLSNGALRDLALQWRGLRASGVTFTNAPVAGLGREGAQSVVYLDEQLAPQYWQAVREGTVAGYLAAHPDEALSTSPR
ncbi:LCP family protein [Pseudonocardia sp. WMMC193]|uniref:LCP family protein n=1 Tax=Pseudonocardia sp. WMMC193 TaxID=2911965 RepID=UPI001F367060|nr:LCP family protein [Pseudonocardia sp. WMMC193]MCF7553852.1 LCP family protein [Pseudonocardia sp. WMMC193]